MLARFLSTESNRLVRGSVEIGRISGSFLSGLDLDSVVVRDTSGVLLASIKRLELRYGLGKFIAGQYVLDSARITEPDIHLIKPARVGSTTRRSSVSAKVPAAGRLP